MRSEVVGGVDRDQGEGSEQQDLLDRDVRVREQVRLSGRIRAVGSFPRDGYRDPAFR